MVVSAVIRGSTVKEKINNAFRLLVDNVYTKMGYVNEHLNSERDLIQILAADDYANFDGCFIENRSKCPCGE